MEMFHDVWTYGEMTLEKYSEVIGLPILCVDSGKRIGVVSDIIFSPETREARALLLEHKGCTLGKQVVLLRDVVSLGRDAVIVEDGNCIQKLKDAERKEHLNGKARIHGMRIYTRTGNDLGTVKDVLFDYSTGTIEGVEVSDGLFQDLAQGRNMIPLLGRVEFGEDSILVDREAIEEMTGTGGGLKKKIMKNED
jgi:uncharacterized protein YrrD